ncbi:hypothetical protein [Anabaena sp. PCC 7108]|uniref:hypothetical protein n=1 Tax=Anabaena sp. PCC 7108 TaxID=163908 RepID=UPI001181936E|nr:hypothetical protein [Anabaena sp. PCC 7108]
MIPNITPEFLIKLFENYQFITLGLGSFLLVLGATEKLVLRNNSWIISSQFKLILVVVGIVLMVISVLAMFKDKLFAPQNKIQKELENTTAELEKIRNKIKYLVESSNNSNGYVSSSELTNILEGMENDIHEFQLRFHNSQKAAKWLKTKQESLLQAVKFSDLNSDINNISLDDFRAEIKKYIGLLIESLETSKNITPRRRKITYHINKPLPYIEVMEFLQIQIKQEVDKHPDLTKEEFRELNNCIDALIRDIQRE